jgi:hypothetical protein
MAGLQVNVINGYKESEIGDFIMDGPSPGRQLLHGWLAKTPMTLCTE